MWLYWALMSGYMFLHSPCYRSISSTWRIEYCVFSFSWKFKTLYDLRLIRLVKVKFIFRYSLLHRLRPFLSVTLPLLLFLFSKNYVYTSVKYLFWLQQLPHEEEDKKNCRSASVTGNLIDLETKYSLPVRGTFRAYQFLPSKTMFEMPINIR